MKARTLLLCTVAALTIGIIGSVSGAASNVFTFDGKPSSPQSFNVHTDFEQFDVQVHSRNQPSWGDDDLPAQSYDHGMNCGGSTDPGSFPRHTHTSYEDAVFLCNDHFMTANAGSGYGAVVITPNKLIDLSGGKTVTVSFRMSTFRHSDRDWLEFGFTPYEDNFTIPCRFCPDLQGEPENYVSLHMSQENGSTGFALYENGQIRGGICPCYESWLTPDKARRDLFEIEFSNTHVTVRMPEYNKVMKEVSLQDLGWGQVVFQMIHHSYDPQKGHPMHGGQAGPTTWHWDDIGISPSTTFDIIKSDKRALLRNGPGDLGVMTFDRPAPSNSHLRFSAYANPDVSFDGGKTWKRAVAQRARKHNATESYFIPIPQGTQQVHFRANCIDWYCNEMHVKDVTIWSRSGSGSSTPPPTSTPQFAVTPPGAPVLPTATPTADPSASPSPTPSSSPSPGSTPDPTSTPGAVTGEYSLAYSTSAGRGGAAPLEGAQVSGNLYAFLTPEQGVSRVSFWLDNTSMSGAPRQVETTSPYDVAGGSTTAANALDTNGLSDGPHTITARVELGTGSWMVLHTTFTVDNTASAPTDPPPSSDEFQLLYSEAPDRSGALGLDGARVSGRIYAFATPEGDNIRRVSFWLNDNDMSGLPRQVEMNPPYDFAGGEVSTATAFDTRWVRSGMHTITTRIEFTDGTSVAFDTTFRVR